MDNPTNDETSEEPVSGAPFTHRQQAQKSNHYGQHSKKIIPNVIAPAVAETDNEVKKPIQSPYNPTPLDNTDKQIVEDSVYVTSSNSVESAKEVINKLIPNDQESIEREDAATVLDTGEWHIPISKEAKKLDKTYRRKSIKSESVVAIVGLVVVIIGLVAAGFVAYFVL